MCGGGGFLDNVVNVLTGGTSNAFGGTKADYGDAGNVIYKLVNPIGSTIEGTQAAVKAGDYQSALHQLSTAAPAIDQGLYNFGDAANKISNGASGKFMNVAAPAVGTYAAGPWGSAIGSMVAGRWNKGYYNLSEADIQKRTAISAATAWATQGLGDLAGSLTQPTGASSPTYNTGSFSEYSKLANGTQPYQPTFYEPVGATDLVGGVSNTGQGAGFYTPMSTTPDLSTGLLADAGRTWNEVPQSVKEVGKEVLQKGGKMAFDNFMASMMGEAPKGFTPQEAPAPLPNWGGVLKSPKTDLAGVPETTALAPSNVQFGTPDIGKEKLKFGDYLDEYLSPEEKEKKKKEEEQNNKNWLSKYTQDNSMYNYLA